MLPFAVLLAGLTLAVALHFPFSDIPGDTQWQIWKGNTLEERPLVDGGGDHTYVDPLLCFDSFMLIAAVRFFATAPGPCFRLLLITHAKDGSDRRNVVTVEHVFVAENVGLNEVHLWPNVVDLIGACIGFSFVDAGDPEDGSCRVPYSEGEGEPGYEIRRPFSNRDVVDTSDFGPLTARFYSISVAMIINSGENWIGVSKRFDLPEWETFYDAYLQSEDWGHPEVGEAAVALQTKLAAEPGMLEGTIMMLTPYYIQLLNEPWSLFPQEEHWIDRMHGIVAMILAVTLHVCQKYVVANTWSFRSESEALEILEAFDDLKAVTQIWRTPFTLAEHTRWELSFYDLSLFITASNIWAQPACLGGPSPAQKFRAFSHLSGWVPPPQRAESWYFAPPSCSLLTLGAVSPRAPLPPVLQVVIVETHHADFQEARSLLSEVTRMMWNHPASYISYLLNLAGGDFSLSWGEEGPAETRDPALYGRMTRIESLKEGLGWVRSWFEEDKALRAADLVFDCVPVWVCVAMQRVMPSLPVIVRINMALLQFFFAWDDLLTFWSWMREFAESPNTAIAAKNRLVAEQIHEQTGIRPEYVPLVMLHTKGITYQPASSEVLVFKCSHPAWPHFKHLLKRAAGDHSSLLFHDEALGRQGPLSYRQMASFRAVVVMPHVPNSCSFHDVYAMSIPTYMPAEPYIYNWMWSFSDPYAGPRGDPRKRSVAPEHLRAANRTVKEMHAFPVFPHIDEPVPNTGAAARSYWFQYSDYAMLPAIQRFRSAAHLLRSLDDLSDANARKLSEEMRSSHASRVAEVVRWTACTMDVLVGRRRSMS